MRGILFVLVLFLALLFVPVFAFSVGFDFVVGSVNESQVYHDMDKPPYSSFFSVFFPKNVFVVSLGPYRTYVPDKTGCRDRGFYVQLFGGDSYLEDFSLRKYKYGWRTNYIVDKINLFAKGIGFYDWDCNCRKFVDVFKGRSRESHIHYSLLHPKQPVFYCHSGDQKTWCNHKFNITFTVLQDFVVESAFVTVFDEVKHFPDVSPSSLFIPFSDEYGVASTNPDVKVWFFNSGEWKTSNPDDFVVACVDKDHDDYCDYEKESFCADSSRLRPGDFFQGSCCGDVPYDSCGFYSDKGAFCGPNSSNFWSWAALGEPGVIGDLSAPDCLSGMLVSDGSKFLYCGSDLSAAQSKFSGVVSFGDVKRVINGHDYFCIDNRIVECGGVNPYSRNALLVGDSVVFNNKRYFCTAAGSFSPVISDEFSCVQAGFNWSGSKCCGEPDDSVKFYEDSLGGCFDDVFVPSGSFVDSDKRILNFKGNFTVCDNSSSNVLPVRQSHPLFANTPITPFVKGSCGPPLLDVVPSVNAVCMPWGSWQFTPSDKPTVEKQTAWPSDHMFGCCPVDECWNGSVCVPFGSYYNIGVRGFRCE